MRDFAKGNQSPNLRISYDTQALDRWLTTRRDSEGIDGSGEQMDHFTYAQFSSFVGAYGDPFNFAAISMLESTFGAYQLPRYRSGGKWVYLDRNDPTVAIGMFGGVRRWEWPAVISGKLKDHLPMVARMKTHGDVGSGAPYVRARAKHINPVASGKEVGYWNCALHMFEKNSKMEGRDLQDACAVALPGGGVILGWSPLGVAFKVAEQGKTIGMDLSFTNTRWTVRIEDQEYPIPRDSTLLIPNLNIEPAEWAAMVRPKSELRAGSKGRIFDCTPDGRADAAAELRRLFSENAGTAFPTPFPWDFAGNFDSVNGVITDMRDSDVVGRSRLLQPLEPPAAVPRDNTTVTDPRVFLKGDRRFSAVISNPPAVRTPSVNDDFSMADDFTEVVLQRDYKRAMDVWTDAIAAGVTALYATDAALAEFSYLYKLYIEAAKADSNIRLRPTPHLRFAVQHAIVNSSRTQPVRTKLLRLISSLPSTAFIPAGPGDLMKAFAGMTAAQNQDAIAHRLPMCAMYKSTSMFMAFHAGASVPAVLPLVPMIQTVRRREFGMDFFLDLAVRVEPMLRAAGSALPATYSPAFAINLVEAAKRRMKDRDMQDLMVDPIQLNDIMFSA